MTMPGASGHDGDTVHDASPDAGADAGRYFLTPQLEQRLELVRHLLDFSQQIILVNGAPDGGKSAFVQELLERSPDNWQTAVVPGSPDLLPEGLLLILNEQLGSAADSDRAEDLAASLAQLQRMNQVGVAVIDDADRLPLDSLRQLLELAQPASDDERLHLVLAGSADLSRLLADERLGSSRVEISHAVDIPPFTLEQTEAFIDRYLLAAGLRVTSAMQEPGFAAEVHRESRGLPGPLIELLVLAAGREATGGGVTMPALKPAHWSIAGGLAVIVAGVWLLFSSGDDDTEAPPARLDLPAAATEQPAVTAIELPPAPAEATQAAGPPAAAASRATPVTAAEPEPASKPPLPPAPPRAAPAGKTPAAQTENNAMAATVAAAAGEAAKPAAAQAPEPPAPERKPAVEEPDPEPAKVARKAEKTPKKPQKPTTAIISGVKGSNWIRQQQPERYVLQLFGVHEAERANAFLEGQAERAEFAVFRTTYRDRPWYVVVYGIFSNRDAARAAISGLPPELSAFKPWARSIDSIQQSLP